MTLKTISRYYHTVKHLKPKQIFYQLYYRVSKPTLKQKVCLKTVSLNWHKLSYLSSQLTDYHEFHFFDQKGHLHDPTLWNNSQYTKLWLYQLHYFDELNCTNAHLRTPQMLDYINIWIERNPPAKGNGWEPYPLSLRIVNWIKWFAHHPEHRSLAFIQNLQQQVYCLEQKIEYHILANHLFANAKALTFAGIFFQGHQATKWLKKGLHILDKECSEQFLEDGGHFELSPMYHALILWDICDLIYLAQSTENIPLKKRLPMWQAILTRGLHWLLAMIHPDGEIAFFNDSTLGVAPTYKQLKDYATFLDIPFTEKHLKPLSLQHLKSSGYCIVQLNQNTKAILDTAPVGPSYQPGHAHADTLSFELSIYQQRFIVNSGISQYGEDITRQQQRSTTAHTTVSIDQMNSSDVWSGFRVAQRAMPYNFKTQTHQDTVMVHCAHDGYRRLSGQNRHQRTWTFSPTYIHIKDEIVGAFQTAYARFYFHPDVRLSIRNETTIQCDLKHEQAIQIRIAGAKKILIEESFWYPAFGMAIPNQCLVIDMSHHPLETMIQWSLDT